MGKPGALDFVIVAAFVVATLFEWLWYWPRCVQAIKAHVPGARVRAYRNIIIAEWLLTLYVLGAWIAKSRPWSALWLGSIGPLRLSAGFLVAAIIIALLVLQMRKVQKALARPKAVAHLREQLAFAHALAPETSGERYRFWLVSITAGICEEILFRGFLVWFFAAWTGLVAAIILSSIVFGFGHIYLGVAHVPKTALVGFLLALVVVTSGSLLPAMVIHAALDLNAGELGFRVSQAASTNSPSVSVAKS